MITAPAAVAETHSAAVFFLGDRVYKIKKPVDLGFLDFRSREVREAVCHREVELNRRLSPDVYLGVADVLDPDGEVCDHLVVMRRMPADRRLSTMVAEGADVDAHLRQLARLVAGFHAGAERSRAADEAAGADATARRWQANSAEMLHLSAFDPDAVNAVARLADRYVAGRSFLFARRVHDGRACDGHGDLLAGDIFCLDDGPRVLDCIEFDDRLRYGDTLADVAFLAMDLEHLGRADLAERFLATYRELTNDNWPSSLAHHHIAYRAQVRSKVTAIRADQGDSQAGPEAQRLLALSHAHLAAARVRLVLVGGLPGTGKSTVARALGDAKVVTVLRSDEIRKELAGIPTDHPAPAAYGEGIYTPAMTEDTYTALLKRARVALELGETVVLDASWNHRRWRDLASALATGCHADLVEIRCVAPPEITATRMRSRATAGADASDATPHIADGMAEAAESWQEATDILTTGSVEESLEAALQVFDRLY